MIIDLACGVHVEFPSKSAIEILGDKFLGPHLHILRFMITKLKVAGMTTLNPIDFFTNLEPNNTFNVDLQIVQCCWSISVN